MKRLLFVIVAASVLAAPAAAKELSFVIRGDHSFAGVGFRMNLADAKRVFGAPSSVRMRPQSCIVSWRRYGLVVQFFAFEPNPCKVGTVLSATMTGSRWHTLSGLRIGDPASAVKQKHPRATLHDDGWWLVSRKTCELGGFQPYGSLVARLRNGRVSSFFFTGSVCD